MRTIHISDAKKRDATVGFEAKPTRKKITQVLKNGSPKNNVKILKSTLNTDISTLQKEYTDLEELAQEIIRTDIECDIETTGMLIENTNKIYVNIDNEIVFNVHLLEIQKDAVGKEISRQPFVKKDANIAIDTLPLTWSGKFIPKAMAVKKFVFARHYQIKHTNGLTYDFLYDMAKELSTKNAMMFVGAGAKGNEPIRVTAGGTPYRGFLEGRVNGDTYMLILHLTNLELKEFSK